MLFVFYAYRSLVSRLRANAVTLLSLCLLVAGTALGLTFYLGLKHMMIDTTPAENIIVLARGASIELDSQLDRNTADRVAVRDGIKQQNGQPLIARELVNEVLLDTPRPGESQDPVTLRGIDDLSTVIHHATVVQGSLPAPNSLDVMLGRRVAQRYPNLPVGAEIHLPGGACKISGIFATDGSPFEDEVWTTKSALALHLKDNTLQSMTIVAADSAQVPAMVAAINTSKDLEARAEPVSSFRAKGAGLSTIAWIVFAVLAILVVLGTAAIATTMNASVDMRIPELGAMAAIGIRRKVLGNIVLFEALALGVLGGALGAGLSILGGHVLGSLSVGATPVSLSPPVIVLVAAVILGFVVGLIGGTLSSMPVRRLDILEAMR